MHDWNGNLTSPILESKVAKLMQEIRPITKADALNPRALLVCATIKNPNAMAHMVPGLRAPERL